MGVLKHRRFRRRDPVTDDDDDLQNIDDEDAGDYEDEYDSPISSSTSRTLPTMKTENPMDKAKAIGQEVIKKVPSKYI